jgi:hypothetical protein
MQEIMMNKIIPIPKKARKKLWLARYPALTLSGPLSVSFGLNFAVAFISFL